MSDSVKRAFSHLALADVTVPAVLTESERAGLRWIRQRLQSTEPMEIVSRIQDIARHAALAAMRESVRPRAVKDPSTATGWLKVPELSSLETVNHEERKSIYAEAEQWLAHRGSFLGLTDMALGDRIDWHRDYSSGLVAPRKYSALINHRNAADVGDVKYIWELNRLQHLLPLALSSLWTDRETYDKELEEQTRSWREQNPFMIGLNWKSPLEAGLRLISWALVSFVKGGWSSENGFRKELLETIYQHQYFIDKFYSKHSSANNHLVGEMAGLYIASVFWPCFRESARWRSMARQKLIEEITRQVEDDGVGKERATEYQLFILEFFLLAGALGHAIGDDFPPDYWERIGRLAGFLAAISDRNGNVPMLGDGDGGQVVCLPQTVQERVRSLLSICGRNEQSVVRDEADLRSRLLLWGRESTEMPLPACSEPNSELQTFPRGGYHVLAHNRGADDEVIVVFDAGPLGFAPLYAHGHADALSFWLSYGGHEFLIDPGTYTYYTNEEWREYFRSTAAHNTIRIDGLDQSVPGGRFLWSQVAGCYAEYATDTPDCGKVRAYHDGYRRLKDPVTHHRELRLDKTERKLTVTDFIECQGGHDVEIFFHFSEQCEVRQTERQLFTVLNGDRSIEVRFDARFEPMVFRGAENPISGWISRRFGVKEPTVTLKGRVKIEGFAQFVSEIILL